VSPRNQNMPQLEPAGLTWAIAPRPAKRTGRKLSGVIRVSQRKGREGDAFMSPEQQVEIMLATAARNGDEIVSWHDETDSVSGGTMDRVGVKAALHEAMSGITDGVIVAKVNRFARTKRAGEALIYDLIEKGLSFIAAANNIDTAGGKLDRGTEVYLDFLLRQAEWEREDLTANWQDVRHRHVNNGVAVHACYGYRKDPKTRKLVKEPTEALWVQRIFKWRAAGKSWSWIADELNSRKVKPPQTKSKKVNASKQWVPQHIPIIINRRTYLGEMHRGDAVNLKSHKRIISADLWQHAHAVRVVGSADTKADAAYFPLAGRVRCASCGGRMTGSTQGAVKKRYYHCRKRYPWDICPKPAFVSADDLEAEVWADFEHRALARVAGSSVREDQSLALAIAEVDRARAELREYNRKTAAAREELGDDDFVDGLTKRTDAVRHAQKVESDARAVSVGVDLPVNIAEDWTALDLYEQAAIITAVYHCVAVRPTTTHKAHEPAKGRMRVWLVGDADAPTNLPGRPIGRSTGKKVVNKLRPITWKK
jgi:DNA invertase Pin-like site-specific DNA recombinase